MTPVVKAEPASVSFKKVPLVGIILFVATLYFGREFFLPLALAVLISFLLAPLIRLLERWHCGRIGSVIIATVLAFSVIGGVGYVITGQLVDLAEKLPTYKTNLLAKVASFKSEPDSTFTRATATLREVTAEIGKTDAPKLGTAPEISKPEAPPVPVAVVEHGTGVFDVVRSFVAPILGPLGTAAVVVIFVIFMLLEREDLRDRIIHLVGRGRLRLTTQALDEAGRRVSRYLLAQLIVNVTYGIPVAVALHFFGVPNAVLWGLLATLLRFIPYLGPWIAAAFPVAVSLAVSPSWSMPLMVIGFLIVLELISNNVVEPWLYGASTGLSPMAVIVAAVFWTWLWGTIGLLLATPLTVCIAVLGKYIPNLEFLDVLIGDKPPIAPGDRLYQRLLARDEEEALEIVEKYVKEHSLAEAYDDVVVPAVTHIEVDCREGVLGEEIRHDLYQIVSRLLSELDETPPPPPTAAVPVLCLPASSEADELMAVMLAHLLEHRGTLASVGSFKSLASEMVEQAVAARASIFCISALPPISVMPAIYLAKRIRSRQPEAKVLIGLWHDDGLDERRRQRMKRANADDIFLTLDKASAAIAGLAGLTTEPEPAVIKAA